MDLRLKQAAKSGDVAFLREAVASQPPEYLMSTVRNDSEDDDEEGNIFQLAAWNNREDFIREALKILPTSTSHLLISQRESSQKHWSSLHAAAIEGNLGIVKLILDFYRTHDSVPLTSSDDDKPWLALDKYLDPPANRALMEKKDECALELLLMDMDVLSSKVNEDNDSPLCLAVKNGCSRTALAILTKAGSYSVSGEDGWTPLHLVPNSSEEVCKRLLERHPELIKETNPENGYSVLHKWVAIGKPWPFECALRSDDIDPSLKKELINLLSTIDRNGDNPLHLAATHHDADHVRIAQILVDAYKQDKAGQASSSSQDVPPPWLMQNNKKNGDTPLHLALQQKRPGEKLAMCFLSPEINSLLRAEDEENPLFLAILKECYRVAEWILELQQQSGWSPGLVSGPGKNVLHGVLNYPVTIATWLVQRLPLLITQGDQDGKTPLDEASDSSVAWLTELMLKRSDPTLLRTTLAPRTWVSACERGDLPIVVTFIEHCPYFREICLEHRDTPLHHIHLGGYRAYQEFLETPFIRVLKNTRNALGATPLHQAIKNRNIQLAEVLLSTDGVDRTTRDCNNESTMDSLAKACDEAHEWVCSPKSVFTWPN